MDEIYLEKKNNDNFKDFDNFYCNGLLFIELFKDLWNYDDFYLYKINFVKYMKYFNMLVELDLDLWYVLCMNK